MNQQNQTAPQTAAPKTFNTINGNTLMAQEYEPLKFTIEKILPYVKSRLSRRTRIIRS